MGCCPFLGLCRDREFSVAIENADPVSRHGFLCHDMVLRPSAQLGLGMRNKCVNAVEMRARLTEVFDFVS